MKSRKAAVVAHSSGGDGVVVAKTRYERTASIPTPRSEEKAL